MRLRCEAGQCATTLCVPRPGSDFGVFAILVDASGSNETFTSCTGCPTDPQRKRAVAIKSFIGKLLTQAPSCTFRKGTGLDIGRLRAVKGEIALLGVLMCCQAQAAGERFTSDFEGSLVSSDNPPGPWGTVDLRPGSTCALSTSAATRGMQGMRIDDQLSVTGRADNTAVYVTVTGAPMPKAQLRFQFKATSTSPAGSAVIGQILSDAANRRSLCDVSVVFPAGLITLGGDSRSGTFTVMDSGVRLASGSKVLIECTLEGLGTDAGLRTVHIDAVQVAQEQVDFGGLNLRELALGEPFSEDSRFVGQLDFDDVRLADRMQASRLRLDAGRAAVDQGECAPVEVAVSDSIGNLAGLPYAATFSAAVDGGALYSDARCSVAMGSVPFALEQTSGVIFLRPGAAPQVAIGLTFSDLIGTSLVLAIRPPDAGTADAGIADAGGGGPGHSYFTVGCNCQSASSAPLLLIALAGLARRRRVVGSSAPR